MNKALASRILGVLPDVSDDELKKRYRELMRMTHPDAVESHDYPYEVYDINRAYEYMLEHIMDRQQKEAYREKKKISWNAPINRNAYTERPIYQYYQDESGENIGTVNIDFGKYMWIPDEDFSLFLKSLYETAKNIIAQDDEKKGLCRTENLELMSNITYLLAGQFFGTAAALSLMKKENGDIYYTKAMLEHEAEGRLPKEGEILIPQKVDNHRLYVCDVKNKKLGYISFKDDRLLFGIIPLFERRAVQLKMICRSTDKKLKTADVDMWIKLLPESTTGLDSINIKIANLLNKKVR